MDQFADKFADFLEALAQKVRSLTVDRLDRLIIVVSLGIIAAVLAFVALTLLSIALFRIVATYVTSPGAYAIFGGIFIIAGAFAWTRRKPEQETDNG